MKGYEIFKRISDETKGGERFKDHPLANVEFETVRQKGSDEE